MKLLSSLLLMLAVPVLAETTEIGLVTMDNADVYWKFINAGAQKAVKELQAEGKDVKVTWEGPSGGNPVEGQTAIVQAMVARKIKGLLIAPCSSRALVAPVEAAHAAGIPTVVVDAGLDSSVQLSFIATDNAKGGFIAARRMGTLMGGKGRTLVFAYYKGRRSTEQRLSGYKYGLENQHPEITSEVSEAFVNGITPEAIEQARQHLKAHGSEIGGIFTPNTKITLAVLQLLKELNLAGGRIKFVGFDVNAESIAALQSGDMQGFVAQNPLEIGYLGVKTLMAAFAGEVPERQIEAECLMVTPENLEKPAVSALLKLPSD